MQGFDQVASVNQIISDLNLTNDGPSGPVYSMISALWLSYADKVNIYPRLQTWYTYRQVADNLLGGVWQSTEWKQADVEENNAGFSANLGEWRKRANDEIMTLEGHANANVAMVAGQPTVTAPGMPTSPFAPDPNGPCFRGDPRFPSRGPSL